MLSLPDALSRPFNTALDKGQHSANSKHFYRKWLRFYWDFCHKYQHEPFHRSSLSLFLKKLEQKGPSVQQREQAGQAIELFYQAPAKVNADSAHLKTSSRQTVSTQPPPMPDVPSQKSTPEPGLSIRRRFSKRHLMNKRGIPSRILLPSDRKNV